MKPLTFKGLLKNYPVVELCEGLFSLSKFGHSTPNEEMYFADLQRKRSDTVLMMNDVHLDRATTVLKSRHDPSWTVEQTKASFWPAQLPSGEAIELPVQFQWILDLSEFWQKERDRDSKYVLKLEGKNSKPVAYQHAENIGGIFAEAEGLETFYVFEKPEDVMEGLKILESFCTMPVNPPAESNGASTEKKELSLTGTVSA